MAVESPQAVTHASLPDAVGGIAHCCDAVSEGTAVRIDHQFERRQGDKGERQHGEAIAPYTVDRMCRISAIHIKRIAIKVIRHTATLRIGNSALRAVGHREVEGYEAVAPHSVEQQLTSVGSGRTIDDAIVPEKAIACKKSVVHLVGIVDHQREVHHAVAAHTIGQPIGDCIARSIEYTSIGNVKPIARLLSLVRRRSVCRAKHHIDYAVKAIRGWQMQHILRWPLKEDAVPHHWQLIVTDKAVDGRIVVDNQMKRYEAVTAMTADSIAHAHMTTYTTNQLSAKSISNILIDSVIDKGVVGGMHHEMKRPEAVAPADSGGEEGVVHGIAIDVVKMVGHSVVAYCVVVGNRIDRMHDEGHHHHTIGSRGAQQQSRIAQTAIGTTLACGTLRQVAQGEGDAVVNNYEGDFQYNTNVLKGKITLRKYENTYSWPYQQQDERVIKTKEVDGELVTTDRKKIWNDALVLDVGIGEQYGNTPTNPDSPFLQYNTLSANIGFSTYFKLGNRWGLRTGLQWNENRKSLCHQVKYENDELVVADGQEDYQRNRLYNLYMGIPVSLDYYLGKRQTESFSLDLYCGRLIGETLVTSKDPTKPFGLVLFPGTKDHLDNIFNPWKLEVGLSFNTRHLGIIHGLRVFTNLLPEYKPGVTTDKFRSIGVEIKF